MESTSFFWKQSTTQDSNKFYLKKHYPSKNCLDIQLKFQPQPNTEILDCLQTHPKMLQTYPVFNHDSNYFTPGFTLEIDIPRIRKTQNAYLEYHVGKIKQINQQIQQIFVAKPASLQMFCHVCRQKYQDYKEHSESEHHKTVIKKSKYHKQIQKLSKKIKKQEQIRIKQQKKLQKQKNIKIKKQKINTREKKSKVQINSQNNLKNKLQINTNDEQENLIDLSKDKLQDNYLF